MVGAAGDLLDSGQLVAKLQLAHVTASTSLHGSILHQEQAVAETSGHLDDAAGDLLSTGGLTEDIQAAASDLAGAVEDERVRVPARDVRLGGNEELGHYLEQLVL